MDTIKITKVTDTLFLVEWKLANGWQDMQQCTTEDQARSFAAGLQRGVKAVSHMIGNGLHFDGVIR